MLFKMSPSEDCCLPVYTERFPEKIDSNICFYCSSILRFMCRKRSLVIPGYDTQSGLGGRWNRRDGPMVISTGYFSGDPGLVPSTPRAAQKPSLTTIPEIWCPCGPHVHCMHSVHLDASKMLIQKNLKNQSFEKKNVRRY